MNERIVFMGSPSFSVPILQTLAAHYPVVGVVTQPDRPAGRGQVLAFSPVKTAALALNLPIIQPERMKQPEAQQCLRDWAPDVIVVAAFGQILRQDVLTLPPKGCVNVHASLLPRWRGASPIQAAILHGDQTSGVSIMLMDTGVDTGPVLRQKDLPILATDTAETLEERLSSLGAELLMDTLPGYLAGEIMPVPQDEQRMTKTQLMKKEDGLLDLELEAISLERCVRAYYPWPGAYSLWQGQVFKILAAHVAEADGPILAGKEYIVGHKPAWGTGKGLLVLDKVQPAGKKPMDGETFLRGARKWGKAEER